MKIITQDALMSVQEIPPESKLSVALYVFIGVLMHSELEPTVINLFSMAKERCTYSFRFRKYIFSLFATAQFK